MRLLVAAAVVASGCGRIGFDSACELGGPCVRAVTINAGESFARGPRLAIAVETTDATELRVVAVTGDCQDGFADDRWQPIDAPRNTVERVVEPSDGVKKVCAWGRDATGRVSLTDRELAGVTFDTITYEAERVPFVETFELTSLGGGRLEVSFTVTDVEGLADRPIELAYTTEEVDGATWTPLVFELPPLGERDGIRQPGTALFDEPTTEPYVVRLIPIDRAGNRGIAAISDVQNAPGWSVYLGSTDRGVGGAARAARLELRDNTGYRFAVDPVTHDVYATDEGRGVIRLDAATGLAEQFLAEGALNLPDNGPLPVDAAVPGTASLRIGADRRLYIGPASPTFDGATSGVIYQIDLATRHTRRYLGGGVVFDGAATPSTVFAFAWIFEFDEDNTLYFLTSCSPGTSDPETRLMKVTQAADGTAGAISVVAGNCVLGMPPGPGPHDPLTTPLGFMARAIGTIVPWDHGRAIYLGAYPGEVWKIVDGQLYSSDVAVSATGSLAYDPATELLYVANGEVTAYRPNLAGANGDLRVDTVMSAAGEGACTVDGIAAADACVNVQFTMQAAGNRIYVNDGPTLNQHRSYRVRFVDTDGRMRTYFGSEAFHGDGLDRRVARGAYGGIHYKPTSAPNQAAFPAGLYAVDWMGLVLGRVDPTTGRVSVEWGNQSGTPREYLSGGAIGPEVSLGVAYFGGNLQPLAFDADGLPWLRYGPSPSAAHVIQLDATRRVVARLGGTTNWEDALDGANPASLDLWPYGALGNLVIANERSFLLGGYLANNAVLSIRLLDFGAGTVTRLMGAAGNTYTPDRLSPGSATTAGLSSVCEGRNTSCFTSYRADQDRLYFTEDHRLRYITQPAVPSASTLETLWAHPSNNKLRNFIFRSDGSQVFYIAGPGRLRCHDLTSGAPWCDDADLGPPSVLGAIDSGANQLTWKDDSTLLISTYRGQVLEYKLP